MLLRGKQGDAVGCECLIRRGTFSVAPWCYSDEERGLVCVERGCGVDRVGCISKSGATRHVRAA